MLRLLPIRYVLVLARGTPQPIRLGIERFRSPDAGIWVHAVDFSPRDRRPCPMRFRVPCLAMLLVAALLGVGCAPSRRAPDSWTRWQRQRMEDVGGPNGWAALAGLHWLRPGRLSIGTHAGCDVVLPPHAATGTAGTLLVEAGRVAFEPAPGTRTHVAGRAVTDPSSIQLEPDMPGPATVVESGGVTWWILARGERMAVRVRDPEGPGRRAFRRISCFRYNPALRIEARFIPFPSPQAVPIRDVTGNESQEVAPGVLLFQLDGVEARLTPVEDHDANDWFINFRDATSGHGTYPGGRFLHVPRAGPDGRVVLDFNFAYNPPCAFTPFATCPVPPRSNWLQHFIRAGEKFSGH